MVAKVPTTEPAKTPVKGSTNHATTWEEVQRVADELELKIHLAGMDIRERWQALQPRVSGLEKAIAHAGGRASAVIAEELSAVGAALRRLRDDVASGRGH